jgi:hypothetical protein
MEANQLRPCVVAVQSAEGLWCARLSGEATGVAGVLVSVFREVFGTRALFGGACDE